MLRDVFKWFKTKKKKVVPMPLSNDDIIDYSRLKRSIEIINLLEDRDMEKATLFQRWAKKHEKCLKFDIETKKSDIVFRKMNTLFSKYKRMTDKIIDNNNSQIPQEKLETLVNDWLYEFYLAIEGIK